MLKYLVLLLLSSSLKAQPITIKLNNQEYSLKNKLRTEPATNNHTVFIPVETCFSKDLILEIPGHVTSARSLLCNLSGKLGHLKGCDGWLIPFPDVNEPRTEQNYLERDRNFKSSQYGNFIQRTTIQREDETKKITLINLKLSNLVYLFNSWSSNNSEIFHPKKGYHQIDFSVDGKRYIFVLVFWPSISFDSSQIIRTLTDNNFLFPIDEPPYFELNYHYNVLTKPRNDENFLGYILKSETEYENQGGNELELHEEITEPYSIDFDWEINNANEITPPFQVASIKDHINLASLNQYQIQGLKGLNQMNISAIPRLNFLDAQSACHYQSNHNFTLVDENTYFPNAFSPNQDGNNDYWYPYFSDITAVEEFDLKIISRWGELILETNDKNFQWQDTDWKNKRNSAAYIYFSTIKYISGTVKQYSGNINLIL